ncbi:hypothetical protein, partial [Kineococcus sp. SYSU DK018]|uniref:hypothetical protein n=1 Tax=Kineococcus sp. SYSU DK018 TaxID=3383139 RepID=UPI003D7C583B
MTVMIVEKGAARGVKTPLGDYALLDKGAMFAPWPVGATGWRPLPGRRRMHLLDQQGTTVLLVDLHAVDVVRP